MANSIRHLPYFVAVAEEQNFARAAVRMAIVQPALSRRVRDLEAELGTVLLERTSRGAKPTQAGLLLLREGRRILDEFEAVCVRANRVSHGMSGALRLGLIVATLQTNVVNSALKRFSSERPDVNVETSFRTSQEQVQALFDEKIDLGITFFYRDESADVGRLKILDDELLLAVPQDHRLAMMDKVEICDIAGERLSWPARSGSEVMYGLMIKEFASAGVSPNIVIETSSFEQSHLLVSSGLCLSFIRRSAVNYLPADIIAKKVSDFNILMSMELIWLPDRLTAAAAYLLEMFLTGGQ